MHTLDNCCNNEVLKIPTHHKHELVVEDGENVYTIVDDFEDDVLLHLVLYDTKSKNKDITIEKFIPSFPMRPEFCAVKAYLRLAKNNFAILRDVNNKIMTLDWLSSKFRSFVDKHAKVKRPSLKSKKITYYVFRVSFINLASTDMDVPVFNCQYHAGHANEATTVQYLRRTNNLKKLQGAKLIRDKLQKQPIVKKR